MNEITLKRVRSDELTRLQIMRLDRHYKTVLGDFVALYDHKRKELLVNSKIPDTDVQIFMRTVLYDGDCTDDAECMEDFEYIYANYGFTVYSILSDAWKAQRRDRRLAQAEEITPRVVKAIGDYIMDDDSPSVFDEFLVYQICSTVNKKKRTTAYNLVGADTEYVFYLGYLMGKGVIHDV
ncbi:hypothetical protein NXH76_17320 [Blautia schinkii]|nr:hypothetical protein [Blautia schinkii]